MSKLGKVTSAATNNSTLQEYRKCNYKTSRIIKMILDNRNSMKHKREQDHIQNKLLSLETAISVCNQFSWNGTSNFHLADD